MNAPRHVRILGIVLAVLAAQGLAVLVFRWVEQHREATKTAAFRFERLPRAAAPDLVLSSPDGSSQRLADLRGKPVLLHFWATWCPPCKEELPGLLQLGRELAGAGDLELVALSMDKDWVDVREFFNGEIPPEVMRDSAGSAADRYDVSTLPDTYLLRADGSMQLRFGGAREWRTELARNALRQELSTGRGE